jgi:hypothetical protein
MDYKNAEKCLAVCNAATPKWIDTGNEIISAVNPMLGIGGFLREEDNVFAVMAREALPYWVERCRQLEAELASKSVVSGETSDGYHTFNELYHHRAVLFSVICNQNPNLAWKSKLHHDSTMYDGMFIVGIDTPGGQATYHYDIDPYWDMFLVSELPNAPEWDGHTPSQAIERIGNMESSALLDRIRQLEAELIIVNASNKWLRGSLSEIDNLAVSHHEAGPYSEADEVKFCLRVQEIAAQAALDALEGGNHERD